MLIKLSLLSKLSVLNKLSPLSKLSFVEQAERVEQVTLKETELIQSTNERYEFAKYIHTTQVCDILDQKLDYKRVSNIF